MDPLTIILLLIAIVVPYIAFSKNIKERRRIAKAVDAFGGEQWYPFFGTTYKLITAGRKNFWRVYHGRTLKLGPVFRTWMGSVPAVHIMKPEHCEIVFKSSTNINKGDSYKFALPWLGHGLITSGGKRWRHHRKLLTPTFHFSILDNFQEIFSEKAQMLAERLSSKADGSTFFDIYPYLTHCSLDVICETAMGVKVNAMNDSDSEYVKAVYGIANLMLGRMLNPLMHNSFLFGLTEAGWQHQKYLDILHGFTRKVITEKMTKLRDRKLFKRELSEEDKLDGKKERLAFLDHLLSAVIDNKELDPEEIREEVDTFMFAGHDTSTVSSCWTLFGIALNPKVQEKIHEELDSIFHGEERPITPEDLGNMKYLERVVKEGLRCFPMVPIISRTLTEPIKIDGREVPAGVQAVLHLYELHKDPNHWPDPDRFDPDRFLPERSAGRHPYAFVPFSAGPRNCLGQKFAMRNTRTMIATIMRKYKIAARDKPEDIECFAELVLRPQNGMVLSLEERFNK